MVRVCHIWEIFFPLGIGGVEQFILQLSNYLSKANSDVQFIVLTEHVFGLSKYEKYESLEVYRLGFNLPEFLRLLSPSYIRNKVLIKVQHVRPSNIHARFLEASNFPRLKQVDIFHSHGLWSSYAPELGFKLSQQFGKPLVFTLHGSFEPGPGKMRLTKRYLTILKDHTNVILCCRESVLQRLEDLGLGDKSYFIPTFVDGSVFSRPRYARDHLSGKNVLFIGRLALRKDPITPIVAFKSVVAEVPDAKLHVVGYGLLQRQIKRLISKLGLEKSVVMHGKQFDVRRFLWNNDIFLATNIVDNYPALSLREAMAAGLAVVATDVGETRSIIRNGENGVLVPPSDPKALAKAMLTLMADGNLQSKLSANAAKTAKQFDVRIIAPKIVSVYKSLLTGDKNPDACFL